MNNRLSIRSYTREMRSHVHDYHQVLLTLNGYIEIMVADYSGTIAVGEAILIEAGQLHSFRAYEAARFIVADMSKFPDKLKMRDGSKFPINAPLLSFIHFVDKQLQFPDFRTFSSKSP